jgi:hypothetical protein
MSEDTKTYKNKILYILNHIAANPSLLKRSLPEKIAFLYKQGNMEAQNTGNAPTPQEACFADIVEKNGFMFRSKNATAAPEDGLYYIYQLKGSQREGDFYLREYKNGQVVNENVLDLKHTQTKTFYLNDGWFQKGVIYIVSWNKGTKKKPNHTVYIAFGEDIPSEEEKAYMTELIGFKVAKNTGEKKIGSLKPYIRFANQYTCERFTDETTKEHLEKILASLE